MYHHGVCVDKPCICMKVLREKKSHEMKRKDRKTPSIKE